MVKYNNNKKGQAAIEFLMTYGWMLLVVLIVGALIFSFVDFGSLLPNKLDMNGNIRGDPANSVAYSHVLGNGNSDTVIINFRYNGANKVTIWGNSSADKTSAINIDNGGGICTAFNITNLETQISSTNNVTFLNGASGFMKFNCTTAYGSTGLLLGDTLTGTMKIYTSDAKSAASYPIPSTGTVRFTIVQP